ncbi:MAG: Na+/H+ antiporter NhaA [Deltaproteobacteria bacterium]|nr:Na+/H+ antiporter NhaA [Deltaproteobacteria bacterium]
MRFLKTGITFLLQNSLFLIAGTVIAVLAANVARESYHHFIHNDLGLLHLEGHHFNLHFIIDDILMCFFFGLAAKEIWEALLPGGALSSAKKAATPLLATAGGVAGPALLYVVGALALGQSELIRGWAIPCATDIAFSYLVARLVFGIGHPAIPFLLLLAIADDAAGLIILAVAYPQGEMNLTVFFACVVGAILFNVFVLKKALKVNSFWPYLLIAGPVSWYGFFEGGIHAALALVPIIPTLPHRRLGEHRRDEFFEGTMAPAPGRQHDALNAFEHWWKNPVEFILMLFGFANAGVAFAAMGTTTWLVSAGLLMGKPIGIVLLTLLATKVFKLELPVGMNMRDLVVLGFMAGIGFTVALFVATVAFPAGEVLDGAKMGALFSFAASILAFIMAKLLRVGRYSTKAA